MSGQVLQSNGTKLLEGPLGNVNIGFDGYDLGDTTEDTVLTKVEDRKDILYSQQGTQPADHVSTGTHMELTCVFGEINTQLLKTVMYQFKTKTTNNGTGPDSGVFDRVQYCSLRDNYAKALRVSALDCDGVESTDAEDILNCYEVLPLVDENIINWGADTQRKLPVTFYIYYKIFDTPLASDRRGAFGYYGDPATEQVPATDWVDRNGPVLTDSEATTATNITLTFDENVVLQGGSYTGGIIVKVNDAFVVPTGATVSTNTSDITLPAASIANGDTVEVSISDSVYEDASANAFQAVDAYPTTNSVP